MAELYIFNDKVDSVFQLLGQKENDISYSVGFTFANCNQFLQKFLQRINIKAPFQPNKIKIRLQAHEKEKGFTDFEIIQEKEFHIIIEAKRGWTFPTEGQLDKYASRPSFKYSSAEDKRIIVINESIPAFTKTHFITTNIQSISVEVVSWKDIQQLASASKSIGRDAENRILKELNTYLNKISSMQKIDSNWVYVVSLGSGMPERGNILWQDIVNKDLKYFHPVGGGRGGWPAEPPNYIAFRYGGILQSIHHIDKYEVFTDPSLHFKTIAKQTWDKPHYLYHLGPAIKPTHEVKAGKKMVRSIRVWAMLDLLLTSQTIQEARDKSKDRAPATILP
ncbi:PD-(D/E)XK nuclease family protein [candidate division TA06 bacterium]|nr:PD-(D/E)XK nuclease family protein [candidate division TA06 bacterium]